MDRIRVAALQYFIRPVQTFEQFRDQAEAISETAADYNCKLLVSPEYFAVQLLTLGDIKRLIDQQIRDLPGQGQRYLGLRSPPETTVPTRIFSQPGGRRMDGARGQGTFSPAGFRARRAACARLP